MKGVFADAVLKVPLKGDASAFLYCVVEHKRTEDRQVLLQLLRYLTAVYTQLATTHRERLPVVVPLIIYNGVEEWFGPLRFSSLLEGPSTVRRYSVDFSVQFLDIARTPIESISFHPRLKAGLLALRAAACPREELEMTVADLLRQLKEQFDPSTANLFINYLLNTVERQSVPLIEHAVQEQAKEEETMQSAADYLTYLGYRRGKRAGEASGVKKGRVDGIREMTRALLVKRFHKITPSIDKKLDAASPEELARWHLAATDAKALRDVFKP